MSRFNLRWKNHRKAIHPVIATIILIAVTLVLALVVGAYTFGLFGSNVKTIQLTSAILGSGAATTASKAGANFVLTFNNPGPSTNITSVALTSGGQTIAIPSYFTCTSPTICAQITTFPDAFVIPNGAGMQAAIYFGAAFLSGDTYVYVVTFANGQSITGSLIAQ